MPMVGTRDIFVMVSSLSEIMAKPSSTQSEAVSAKVEKTLIDW